MYTVRSSISDLSGSYLPYSITRSLAIQQLAVFCDRLLPGCCYGFIFGGHGFQVRNGNIKYMGINFYVRSIANY